MCLRQWRITPPAMHRENLSYACNARPGRQGDVVGTSHLTSLFSPGTPPRSITSGSSLCCLRPITGPAGGGAEDRGGWSIKPPVCGPTSEDVTLTLTHGSWGYQSNKSSLTKALCSEHSTLSEALEWQSSALTQKGPITCNSYTKQQSSQAGARNRWARMGSVPGVS